MPPDAGDGGGGGWDRPTVLVATSIDSTSMFHDLSPGATNAASNALALLAAAHLVGSTIGDASLDALHGRIAFAFFQGESCGYLGSRRFLRDVDVAVGDGDGGGGGGSNAPRAGSCPARSGGRTAIRPRGRACIHSGRTSRSRTSGAYAG